MKPAVYIETTIPSYLVARTAKDVVLAGKQEVTKQWWSERRRQYELFVSQLVYDEAGRGDSGAAQERLNALVDIPFLALDDEALELSDAIVRGGASFPPKPIPMRAILLWHRAMGWTFR